MGVDLMGTPVGADNVCGGCGGISRDAADLLMIHQSDFVRLLAFEDEVTALPDAVLNDPKGGNYIPLYTNPQKRRSNGWNYQPFFFLVAC